MLPKTRYARSDDVLIAYQATGDGHVDVVMAPGTMSRLDIKSPTLAMNRTGDPCAHVEAARDMAARIPGAPFVEYPGNSHSMMLDDMETIPFPATPRGETCPTRTIRSCARSRRAFAARKPTSPATGVFDSDKRFGANCSAARMRPALSWRRDKDAVSAA